MLVKTEQNQIFTDILQDMLKNPEIFVIVAGPLSCLRTQYFRGKECGLLKQMFFYEIKELAFVTHSHVGEILKLSEEIVSQNQEIKGLIIFTACADIISGTNYKKVVIEIKNKFNCPVIVLPRGPLAKRKKKLRERLEIALGDINDF